MGSYPIRSGPYSLVPPPPHQIVPAPLVISLDFSSLQCNTVKLNNTSVIRDRGKVKRGVTDVSLSSCGADSTSNEYMFVALEMVA